MFGEGYTCDQYPRTVRLKPYTIAHGYGWALLVVGGAPDEQIWCRTLFSDACGGWLASSSGLCAEQQWYLGHVGEMHTPLQGRVRFVDATVPALNSAVGLVAPASSGAPLQDMITQLGQQIEELHRNFAAKSDGEKKEMDNHLHSLLQAVEQRSQTTEQGMQTFTAQLEEVQVMNTNRCETMEKHFMDSLARESSSIAAMQREHLDCTNVRLLDMEKRSITQTEANAHELRTMVVESTAKVERLGADIKSSVQRQHDDGMAELKENLGKAIDAIEQNFPAYIIQTLRLFLQQRGLRLQDGDVMQLMGSGARAWQIEDGEEWPADEPTEAPEEDWGKKDWKPKDEDDAEKERKPVRYRQASSLARRSHDNREEGGRGQREERRKRYRREDSRSRRPPHRERSKSRRGNQRGRSADRRGSRRDDQHHKKPCTCPPPSRRRSRSRKAYQYRAQWNGSKR